MQDYEKNMVICSVLQQRAAMQPRMQIRTSALIELGGESLLTQQDKEIFDNAPEDTKDQCTATVDTNELDALVKASESTKEARTTKQKEAAASKTPFVRSTTPKASRPKAQE